MLGCPGPQRVDLILPEVPRWQEGNGVKEFRAKVAEARSSWRMRVSFRRLAVGGGVDTQELVAQPLDAKTFVATLGADQRPETFLKTQTVEYLWRLEDVSDAGDAREVATTDWLRFQVGCQDHGPIWRMAEQDRLVEALDNKDAAALATRGYVPSHGPVALKGMGLAFYKPSTQFGEPDLLFYDGDVLGPMRLAGWGYAFEYDAARWPAKACIPFESWFVHEQGWHLPNGGFVPSPQGLGTPPVPGAVWHGRLWDVHVWRRDGEVPLLSILDDTLAQDAPAAPDGAFFTVDWALPPTR